MDNQHQHNWQKHDEISIPAVITRFLCDGCGCYAYKFAPNRLKSNPKLEMYKIHPTATQLDDWKAERSERLSLSSPKGEGKL